MLKVTDAVKTTLLSDDVALQAMEAGILNLSAYADQIQEKVEKITFKAVKKGTIVAALARLSPEIKSSSQLKPPVTLDDLSIKSPLCDITFAKTPQTRNKVLDLYNKIEVNENAFFTVTQGVSEITIIAPQSLMEDILVHFATEPKAVYTDKVGITVRFSTDYLEVPNMLYTLESALAVHHVNFIEIISTYTEFSLILDQEYLETATKVFKQFLR